MSFNTPVECFNKQRMMTRRMWRHSSIGARLGLASGTAVEDRPQLVKYFCAGLNASGSRRRLPYWNGGSRPMLGKQTAPAYSKRKLLQHLQAINVNALDVTVSNSVGNIRPSVGQVRFKICCYRLLFDKWRWGKFIKKINTHTNKQRIQSVNHTGNHIREYVYIHSSLSETIFLVDS